MAKFVVEDKPAKDDSASELAVEPDGEEPAADEEITAEPFAKRICTEMQYSLSRTAEASTGKVYCTADRMISYTVSVWTRVSKVVIANQSNQNTSEMRPV
tara:strand:+ start:469 stop:768 length:300 start_codon:yes stop_codon:yes gene_type:complete